MTNLPFQFPFLRLLAVFIDQLKAPLKQLQPKFLFALWIPVTVAYFSATKCGGPAAKAWAVAPSSEASLQLGNQVFFTVSKVRA